MQLNSIYLYPNKVEVFTNSLASWQTARYRRVYNRNLKIYRGVDNDIDIRVKNSDQKPVPIVSTEGSEVALTYNIIDSESQTLVWSKDCTIIDAATGKASVKITKNDTLLIEPGFYQYSVILETRESISDTEYRVISKTPMYIDSQYGAVANIEVHGDVYGEFQESFVADKFEYINPAALGELTPVYYHSSIIDAQPQFTTPQSWHTFQFYFSGGYQGSVIIQGSLDDQGATPTKWVNIETMTPTAPTEYRTVQGKWNWFRITHSPTHGSLDKILYR